MYETFEEWFDIFADACMRLGYVGPLMDDAFYEFYENDDCPHETAEHFVKEIKE